MLKDIYDVPHYKFTKKDQVCNQKFLSLVNKSRLQLPVGYYEKCAPQFRDEIQKTELYKILSVLPKGVMHHCHYECNQDLQFYIKHVLTDPNMYFDQHITQFHVGVAEQAKKNNWISMKDARNKFQSQVEFHKHVLKMSCFDSNQLKQCYDSPKLWPQFQKKIAAFFPILYNLKLAKAYFKHICLKFIKNGYDRIQFRIGFFDIHQYDAQGKFVKDHGASSYQQIFDPIIQQIKQINPIFDVGFIACGLKYLSDQENQKILLRALESQWSRIIGIDFVQQQDLFGSLQSYNLLANKILQKYPHIKKVYHAGQTKKQDNNNIQIAIKAGSVRIGHGCNVLKKKIIRQILDKNICFENCPASNVIIGYVNDSRFTIVPTLLNLGIPVSISPDDPGKFNCIDATFDFHMSVVSYDWSLRELKLVIIHSINGAICSEQQKQKLAISFNKKWDEWIQSCFKE